MRVKYTVWLVRQWPGKPPAYTFLASEDTYSPFLLVQQPLEQEAHNGRIKWWLEGRVRGEATEREENP